MVAEEEQKQVSSQDLEEKLEEQSQEYPRTGALSDQPTLEVLEAFVALQFGLSSTEEKDPKATSHSWPLSPTAQEEVEMTSEALGTGGGNRVRAAF